MSNDSAQELPTAELLSSIESRLAQRFLRRWKLLDQFTLRAEWLLVACCGLARDPPLVFGIETPNCTWERQYRIWRDEILFTARLLGY